MHYIYCPTCNTLLGDKYYILMTLTEKNKNIDKSELIIKMVSNYCCKMRLLTSVNLVNITK